MPDLPAPPVPAPPPEGQEPEARAFPGAVLRATPVRTAYAVVAVFYAIIGALAAFDAGGRSVALGAGAACAGPLAAAMLLLHRHSTRGGSRLEVRPDGVHVEGRLSIPRASIRRAVVARGARGVTVSLERAMGFFGVIDVQNAAEGQALVRALGLSAEQSLAEFGFDSRIARWRLSWALGAWGASLVAAALLAWLGAGVVAALLGLASYALLLAASIHTRITVGLDGVLVRWLGRPELIRFTDMRGVDHDGERLTLTLADGSTRVLTTAWTFQTPWRAFRDETAFVSRSAYLDAVAQRVREAMAAGRPPETPAPVATLLRQGRALDAWVRALRGTLRGPGGYREAETAPERLWGTLEDGAAEPEARAAAAVALAPALGEAERGRLREVARVVVSPRLRVALEAAAGDDDEQVIEALAELEAAQAARRAG